jgi:hypothetical protein
VDVVPDVSEPVNELVLVKLYDEFKPSVVVVAFVFAVVVPILP